MNVPSLNSSQALQNPGMDPFESMPEDTSLRILSLLGIKTLAQCCFVSTKWNALVQMDKLWQPIAKKLKLKNKIGLKKACSDNISKLLVATKKAETCLTLQPKTAQEFDAQYLDLEFTAQTRMQEHRFELDQMADELNKKINNQELIKTGYTAHRKLRVLGLSSWEKLEIIAAHLLKFYGGVEAWVTLATDKIKEKDLEGAVGIVNTHLKDNYFDKVKVRQFILADMCQKKQFFEAIDFFKQHCLELRIDKNHHDSSIIFNSCMDSKQFVAAEKYIDEIETNTCKKFQIQQLIDALLTDKQTDQAKRLIKKYYDIIKEAKKDVDAIIWIQIFVKAGEVSKAWVMAHEWKPKADFIIPCFKKMLLENGFTEEAERVLI
jgi:hypothetical protein